LIKDSRLWIVDDRKTYFFKNWIHAKRKSL